MHVGFDIGGTFTDVIAITGDGGIRQAKLLSLTGTIGESIGAFVDEAGDEPVERFIHATTTASNAVIERKVALTGLLTTLGFRDDLEMRGQRRPGVYDINWDRLPPLVDRELRLEIDERIKSDGTVLRALDDKEVERAIQALIDAGVEAIAVCFINAYANPAHEERVQTLLARMAPGVTCCISSAIDRAIGETDRASTTVVNASLIPVFGRYMARLEQQLQRHSETLHIMQSNGGILTANAARHRPASLIESGPAAGVLACSRLAQELGLDRVLSFDMGGTTAKACLIENGRPMEKMAGEVGGHETGAARLFGNGGHVVRMPWLDIVEVGAGGGSIAWIDHGVLKVGPCSAGADPGPVCYGRGGTRPTITDANVALGYINPVAIADGRIAIDREAALAAIERELAVPLGLPALDLAYGMTQIANARMMRALRAVSTERGRDPRTFTLISSGGSGPLHAAALADMLGIRRVGIPPLPGLFSALGLMLADFSQDYVEDCGVPLAAISLAQVDTRFVALEERARGEAWADAAGQDMTFQRQLTLRYGGQSHVLMIDLPAALTTADFHAHMEALAMAEYQRLFSFVKPGMIELVNLRLRAMRPTSRMRFADLAPRLATPEVHREPSVREAYFGGNIGLVSTPVLSRQDVNDSMPGPAIIEEADTTVVIPRGWVVSRDPIGMLFLDRTG